MFRKTVLLLFFCLSLLSVSCGGRINADSSNIKIFSKEVLTIKSSYLRSTFYTAGIALASLINSESDFLAMNMSFNIGENEKIKSLEDGSAKLCFLSGPEAQMAYTGHSDYWEKSLDIKALFGFCPSRYNIIADEECGIVNFQDMRGKRIAINSENTVTGDTFEYLLGLNGINSKNTEIYRVRETIGENMFKRGDVDVIWYAMDTGHSVFRDYLSKKSDARLFSLVSCSAENRLREFLTVYPLYYTEPVYVDEDVFSDSVLTAYSCLAASGSLSDETAYMITKTWFENNDYIRQFMDFYTYEVAVENAAKLPIPMHPGAARYFREKNIIK